MEWRLGLGCRRQLATLSPDRKQIDGAVQLPFPFLINTGPFGCHCAAFSVGLL